MSQFVIAASDEGIEMNDLLHRDVSTDASGISSQHASLTTGS
jgi:hypothetical protein